MPLKSHFWSHGRSVCICHGRCLALGRFPQRLTLPEEMGDFGDYVVVQSDEKVFTMEEARSKDMKDKLWIVLV